MSVEINLEPDSVYNDDLEIIRVHMASWTGIGLPFLSPDLYIERLNTGKFWNGSSFSHATAFPLVMTKPFGATLNEHSSGLFEYAWLTAGITAGEYIGWSAKGGKWMIARGIYRCFGQPTISHGLARRRFPIRRKIPQHDPNRSSLR